MLEDGITGNLENTLNETYEFIKLKMLCTTLFTWENLPNEIEPRYIENALFGNGQAMFYKEDDKFICLPCRGTDVQNKYGEHSVYRVTGKNGYQTLINLDYKEGVRILNNSYCYPTMLLIKTHIDRMSEINNLIDFNLSQQRFPYLLTCDEKTEFSIKSFFKKIRRGDIAIFGRKMLTKDSIEVLNLNTPYLLDKLQDFKTNVENEIMSFIGINNNPNNKKERMIVDEVNVNNDYINLNLDKMLKEREIAVNKINELYDLNIKVYANTLLKQNIQVNPTKIDLNKEVVK